MLSPENPTKGDPKYREKLEQFKKDQANKIAHPEEWGVNRHGWGETEDSTQPSGKSAGRGNN